MRKAARMQLSKINSSSQQNYQCCRGDLYRRYKRGLHIEEPPRCYHLGAPKTPSASLLITAGRAAQGLAWNMLSFRGIWIPCIVLVFIQAFV